MKIKKGKLQQIVREEVKRLVPPSVWVDHGSNSARQEMLKELGGPAAVPRTMDDGNSEGLEEP